MSMLWTGLRILAVFVVGAGLFGVGSFALDLFNGEEEAGVGFPNPVIENQQRQHAANLENQSSRFKP